MPTKKQLQQRLSGKGRIKEVNRRIRLARNKWKAHENGPCRRERDRALALYEELTPKERDQVPQALRVWLRYRSEKYFGKGRKGNGAHS
ncbi:MAG: Precorrin-3B methylase [Verrucomicrobiota bacterium]